MLIDCYCLGQTCALSNMSLVKLAALGTEVVITHALPFGREFAYDAGEDLPACYSY